MPNMKYYSIWIGIVAIIVYVFQYFVSGFSDIFLLKQSAMLEIWRYITAIFLHGSIPHLLFNLFALFMFGLILEKKIGSNKFLLIFFVSGVFANLIAVNFYPESLGMSGAIFGIIGVLVVINPMMGVFVFGMVVPMFIAAIIWAAVDIIGLFIADNTGHIAHLSGIIIGLGFGIFLRVNHETRKKKHTIEIPEHILRKWETLYIGG
ncbi:MAG TPA: rhomboid family intramembrane serine protease [Candidatus Paceibacterota bacterium]|nr:rhomboid family intramembrane serine protease [Candidatus Paceibacterota bacterium]